MLRVTGATAAGGLAAAFAGCTTRSSDSDPVERLGKWGYDPTDYDDGWQQYSLEYQEPSTLSRNRMYLTEAQRQRLFLRVQWADFGDLDYVLDVGAAGGDGSYPLVTAVEGSYGVGAIRGTVAEGSTRVGSVAGRELYESQRGAFAAIAHGESIFLRNIDRPGAEAYLRRSDRSFVANAPAFADFLDRVGVGAYTTVSLAADGGGIGGFSYHIDGPTTTVRLLRPQSLTASQRREFERRVRTVGARLGYPDAATFESEADRFFLSLRMETHEAPIGGDPLALLER